MLVYSGAIREMYFAQAMYLKSWSMALSSLVIDIDMLQAPSVTKTFKATFFNVGLFW